VRRRRATESCCSTTRPSLREHHSSPTIQWPFREWAPPPCSRGTITTTGASIARGCPTSSGWAASCPTRSRRSRGGRSGSPEAARRALIGWRGGHERAGDPDGVVLDSFAPLGRDLPAATSLIPASAAGEFSPKGRLRGGSHARVRRLEWTVTGARPDGAKSSKISRIATPNPGAALTSSFLRRRRRGRSRLRWIELAAPPDVVLAHLNGVEMVRATTCASPRGARRCPTRWSIRPRRGRRESGRRRAHRGGPADVASFTAELVGYSATSTRQRAPLGGT
jgi:hypothetical protein